MDIIHKDIQIKNGKLRLEDLKLAVNGDINNSEPDRNIDLLISGKNLDLRSFTNNLPSIIRNEFAQVSAQKGLVTLNLRIVGADIKKHSPHITAMFLINDAQIFDEKRFIRIENVSIDGEFTNGKYN